jgi:D-serine deaminase-like pyridoxal phosphate-dependent protein
MRSHMRLEELDTPALVLDAARLRRNTERMSARARAAGVGLRPHLKTAKSARVADLATTDHDRAITVSTLAEAEYFLAHGYRDITYAVCAIPSKLAHAARLQSAHDGARIQLFTDDAAVATALGERAAELDARFTVLVEIDSGEHRTGVASDAPALVDIARAIHQSDALELGGVLTHGGHSYSCRTVEEVKAVADEERMAVVNAAARLREAGLPCPTVSAGSTPTAVHADSFEGLTEIRPGVYVFFDVAQLGRQSCAVEDIALSVVATVISHQRAHRRVLIDAGGLALSKDTSAAPFVANAGYGLVCDMHSCTPIGDLHVAAADQEHGFVEGDALDFDALPVGSKVRVLPNHACMTAAAYDFYAVLEGDEVTDFWQRCNGWWRMPRAR